MRGPLIIAALLSACGAAPPPDPFARYSTRRFLRAEGHGPGVRAAEQDALAGVARQISARVRAELQTEARAVGGRTEESSRQRVTTTSEFAHSELIELLGHRCAAGACVAWAVLDRAAATRALAETYEARVAPLRAAVARATGQPQPADLVAYTGDLRLAEVAWAAAGPAAAQLRALGRGAAVRSDRALRQRLRVHQQGVRAALRITLLPGALPPALRPALTSALAGAFTALGLAARPAAECVAGLAFTPSGAVRCDRSPLGPRCVLRLTGILSRCRGAELARVDLSAARLVTVSPRGERAARAALMGRLTAARLAPALGAQLRPTLPIQ